MKNWLLVIASSMLCLVALSHSHVQTSEASQMKIRIKFGDEVLTATMLDTETSRDFVSMLPLKLRMEDYVGTEKIGDLPRRLSTKQAPAGYDPSVGDIAYYSPWGNVAVFYRDAGYAKGLIKLGSLDGAVEKLASQKGDFEAAFEVMNKK